jgi:hypothetical protein
MKIVWMILGCSAHVLYSWGRDLPV